MPLAISDDHVALADVARSFLQHHDVLAAARATLDGAPEVLPPLWKELSALGWNGLHLPESVGGQGYGIAELCVVIEQLGRVLAPVPFVPTVLASAIIANAGDAAADAARLPALADGSAVGAVGLTVSLQLDGNRVNGDAGPVLGANLAQVLVLRAGDDLVVVDRNAAGLAVTPLPSLDSTVRLASVRADGVEVASVLRGAAALGTRLARVLASAEAIGVARAALDAAVDYAKVRVQFGRTIATFQAVKHHAANMLVQIELATAATWDAARHVLSADAAQADLAAAEAATLALPAVLFCARKNIQLHGGIGFTWEHDAHLFLRRAQTLAVAYGDAGTASATVAQLVQGGAARHFGIDLPAEAEQYREAARAAVATYRSLSGVEQRTFLVDSGYLVPHWPKPYGRGAGPLEQLVIEEELAGVEVPNLSITGWNILTILQHGTPDQIERWTRPALLGDEVWCQLFSEPDAGSDAAAIKTRGVRVDGGWKVTGQKVWTSGAQRSVRGFATVRTDFDGPKHQGVTMMVIDLKAPGVEVRPLREATGEALFNEVFFDDVFVPDDDVVGPVGQGWTVARATLGNERVSIGAGSASTLSAERLFELLADHAPDDAALRDRVGELVAEEHAMRLLNIRAAFRAVVGGGPGPEGNLTKLMSANHGQSVTELGLEIAGLAGLTKATPLLAQLEHDALLARCLSIAGGTTEITLNVIAERLLSLPRDPLAK